MKFNPFNRFEDGPKRTAAQAVSVVVLMGGLAWASVPFYDSDEILDQTVTVRFDASVERDMPWRFKPAQREMEVRIGETALAFYEATNTSDVPIAGTASYNVAPYDAGGFFEKIDCFCFEMQVLQPGETMQMPVSFFVDPDIVDDREGQYVHTITLGYTFHQAPLPEEEQQAALDTRLTPATGPVAGPQDQ
jgi:cytochrome c oxidase assembly protein subunit 11